MSPEDLEHIQKRFDEVRAQSNANLLRAHKAESDAMVFRALAVSGWLIVICLALQWGFSA